VSQPEKFKRKYPNRASDHPSVSRCIRAWNRAFHKTLNQLGQNEGEDQARQSGKEHYLRAMPPLVSLDNVRDFIACVTYAQLVQIIRPSEAGRLLAAARMALNVLRRWS
jgi:hypothetical protein